MLIHIYSCLQQDELKIITQPENGERRRIILVEANTTASHLSYQNYQTVAVSNQLTGIG
jgi:hypothetical protein